MYSEEGSVTFIFLEAYTWLYILLFDKILGNQYAALLVLFDKTCQAPSGLGLKPSVAPALVMILALPMVSILCRAVITVLLGCEEPAGCSFTLSVASD